MRPNDLDLDSFLQVSLCMSMSMSMSMSNIDVYGLVCLFSTVDFLFHAKWCIRKIWVSSIKPYSITSIAYNHYTDIYPLLNI